MNGDYENYLYIILFLIIAIPACLFLIFINKRRRRSKTIMPLSVNGGSISIFFDKTGNVTVIPYVKDKYGSGKATLNVVTVRMPYPPENLGYTVKKSLNGCKNSTPCTNSELLDKLGAMDWKQFSSDKRNISLYFREGYGLVFNTTSRQPDGAYRFNTNSADLTMPADIEDAVLGSTLLQLLGKCR